MVLLRKLLGFSTSPVRQTYHRQRAGNVFSSLEGQARLSISGHLNVAGKRQYHVDTSHIRNIAIVAHVDHGKTTLVDKLLTSGGNALESERVMDSITLEKERGITIMSKCTRVHYGDYVLNIVDTPGHQDFGGEVERILSMVDGVALVVDASEGPMSQTKFVLSKALQQGLKPIVVINKVDRPTSRLDGSVENDLFDLFVALGADDHQLDFKVIYASAKEGWAVHDLEDKRESMTPLLDDIIKEIPVPKVDRTLPFSMVVTMIGYDTYMGRLVTGRIESGMVRLGDTVKALSLNGTVLHTGKVTKIRCMQGMSSEGLTEAGAGDIITLAGINCSVSDTICAPEVNEALPAPQLDPPTISMSFGVNTSPLAGRAGKLLTSTVIKQRLVKECENNVAVSITDSAQPDAFEVHGRGELQLGILIEQMRREGYELSISPPRVVTKTCEETGNILEPVEEVIVDVDMDYSGTVIEQLSARKGNLIEFKEAKDKARLTFLVPSRHLLGYRSQIKTDTRGTAIMNSIFHGYEKVPKGSGSRMWTGKLISSSNGVATAYGLNLIQERGELFISPGDEVYEGMVIGQNSRNDDLEVNPAKAKALTNIRAAGSDEAVRLTPPKTMSLEEAITYVDDDEMVEVTPKAIRIRKQELSSGVRARAARKKKAVA